MKKTGLLALILVATDLQAQDTSAARRRDVCFRALNGERCALYVITDFSVETPLGTTRTTIGSGPRTQTRSDFESRATTAFGVARNINTSSSIGVVTLFDVTETSWIGAEVRYRRWLTRSAALEFGTGYSRLRGVRAECFEPGSTIFCDPELTSHGARMSAALVPSSYVTVFTKGELVRGGGENRGAFYVGASGHSKGALAVVGAGALYYLILGSFIGFA